MTAEHDRRLRKEVQKARTIGAGINLFFGFYFFFLIHEILLRAEWSSGLSDGQWILAAVVASTLGVAYTLSKKSLGFLLVLSSNRTLRQNFKELLVVPRCEKFLAWALVLLTLWLGLQITESSVTALLSQDGLEGAQRIFSAMFHPELSIIRLVLKSMVETIFMAFIATALSLPVSFLAGFFSARNLMKGSGLRMVIYTVVRFILNFTRSVEPMIWAIIFSVWVGIGPYAGMLALMLHSIASLAKNYSEQVECIEQGPVEAIEATGANRLQVVWFAVVPQIVLPFLAFTIYRWDINVRMATIIGLVGGGGIGTLLMQYQGLARWNEVGTIIITIAAVVWIMDYLSAKIREAIY